MALVVGALCSKNARAFAVSLVAMLMGGVVSEQALASTPTDEYDKLVALTSQVRGLGSGLAGEQVSLYSGGLALTQTDVSIPGNSALPVEIRRRFVVGFTADASEGFFKDWDLDIPSIHGVFSTRDGWVVLPNGNDRFKRCSLFDAPPIAQGQVDGYFDPNEFWHGSIVTLPGAGD